jgi:hypothetical protein
MITERPPTTAPALDERAFETFLSAWNHHQDLRSGDGSIAMLAASRSELDRLRRRLRHPATHN